MPPEEIVEIVFFWPSQQGRQVGFLIDVADFPQRVGNDRAAIDVRLAGNAAQNLQAFEQRGDVPVDLFFNRGRVRAAV